MSKPELAGCGETHFDSGAATDIDVRDDINASRRMLKKARPTRAAASEEARRTLRDVEL